MIVLTLVVDKVWEGQTIQILLIARIHPILEQALPLERRAGWKPFGPEIMKE